jgi:hypothetical protein
MKKTGKYAQWMPVWCSSSAVSVPIPSIISGFYAAAIVSAVG